MFVWCSPAAVCASRRKRFKCLSRRSRCLGSTFTATRRASDCCSASYTMPMPPRPISWTISKSPICLGMLSEVARLAAASRFAFSSVRSSSIMATAGNSSSICPAYCGCFATYSETDGDSPLLDREANSSASTSTGSRSLGASVIMRFLPSVIPSARVHRQEPLQLLRAIHLRA